MRWQDGISVSYEAWEVNPDTWDDVRRLPELKDGTVERDVETDMYEVADLSFSAPVAADTWVRVYACVSQRGETARVPLFTGLAVPDESNRIGARGAFAVTCDSVLRPCNDKMLKKGWYAPAESDPADVAERLLANSTPAPVVMDGDRSETKLGSAVVVEDGETSLTMGRLLCGKAELRLKLNGYGCVSARPDGASVAVLDERENDIVEPEVTITESWDVPNVFRAVSDDGTVATARDDSELSRYSTVSRHREIWEEDTSPDLAAGETLADYAARRLREEQAKGTRVSYKRRYLPGIDPGDVVTLNLPTVNVISDARVVTQTLNIGKLVSVEEEVELL